MPHNRAGQELDGTGNESCRRYLRSFNFCAAFVGAPGAGDRLWHPVVAGDWPSYRAN